MENNKYKLEQCMSEVISINSDNEIKEAIEKFVNAKAIVWYYDKIEFYSIENNKWSYDLRDYNEIVRLRIFDKEKELHLWRSNGVLKGRLRNDSKGDGTDFVIAKQILNGTIFTSSGISIKATEEKDTEYDLTYKKPENISSDTKDKIALLTRNYIDYTSDINQAFYCDSRFVDFEIVKTDKSK